MRTQTSITVALILILLLSLSFKLLFLSHTAPTTPAHAGAPGGGNAVVSSLAGEGGEGGERKGDDAVAVIGESLADVLLLPGLSTRAGDKKEAALALSRGRHHVPGTRKGGEGEVPGKYQEEGNAGGPDVNAQFDSLLEKERREDAATAAAQKLRQQQTAGGAAPKTPQQQQQPQQQAQEQQKQQQQAPRQPPPGSGAGDGSGSARKVDLPQHPSEFGGHVFFDFTLADSTHFTYVNYKSLESILANYPRAQVRGVLPAPQLVHRYKWGNSLSMNTVARYSKRGFNIHMMPQLNRELSPAGSPGTPWFNKHRAELKGDGPLNDRMRDNRVHFYATAFLRFKMLHRFGGIYLDTSQLLRTAFPRSVTNGLVMEMRCLTDVPERQRPHPQRMRLDASDATHQSNLPECAFSMTAVFPKESPVTKCILDAFPTAPFEKCIADSKEQDSGFGCVQRTAALCMKQHSVRNDLVEDGLVTTMGALDYERGWQAYNHPISDAEWEALGASQGAAVWSGPAAHYFYWERPAEGSVVERLIRAAPLTLWHRTQHNAECMPKCNHYAVPKGARDGDVGMAKEVCSLGFSIAGIMKAATSMMFKVVAQHPQILPPLKGFQYKEAGAYMPNEYPRFRRRVSFFPYIADGEGFMTGDGTVYYMTNLAIMPKVQQDNPDVKVIAMVRNPVLRSYSHWIYIFGGVYRGKNFDQTVNSLLDRNVFRAYSQSIGRLTNGTETLEKGTDMWFKQPVRDDPNSMIRWSMYLYPIKKLIERVGRDNVMVVSAEELAPEGSGERVQGFHRSQTQVAEEVFKFLGLCPETAEEIGKTHVIASHHQSKHAKMKPETFERLSKFFAPFNKELYKLVGRNFGWEEMKL